MYLLKRKCIFSKIVPECKSFNGKNCVFPFMYKGKSYTQCTKDYSENEKFWCANEVEPFTRNIVNEQWGDCDDRCPGTGSGNFWGWFLAGLFVLK